MNNIKITPYKGMTILLFALVLFCTKANAQVMPFGMLHSNEAATAPTITNVAAGDGQVAVTFDHPEANGGATSTVYTVTSSPGERTVTGTSSPITIAELTNGIAYTFTVMATNSAGQSATSAASSAVTPTPILAEDEVYNPTTNKVWKDRNLGATQVAINSTDSDSYGDLFQWGRGADGHQERNSGITPGPSPLSNPGANFLTRPNNTNWYSGTDPQADDLWKEDGTADNDPCPSGFRLPTADEWEKERLSWNYTNGPGPFTSPLKLPRSGFRRNTDGTIINIGTLGFYWSSTIDASKSIAVSFNSGADQQAPFDRAFGFSVRCIKGVTAPLAPTSVEATGGDTQATVTFTAPASNGGATITGYTVTSSPGEITVTGLSSPIIITGLTNGATYTFTVTATNSAGLVSESGVSNEVTLAVPSVTSNTGRIWMDRNLGATQVAESSTDEDSYGYLYQWGRGTDGHQIRDSETSDLLSDTDQPNDGKYILAPLSPNDWRNPQNPNLWQVVGDNINNPCPSGYRLPTKSEWVDEIDSWGNGNANPEGALASSLRLPMAGHRNRSFGDFVGVGTSGFYWSSTVNNTASQDLRFSNGSANIGNSSRANAAAVRCIKEVTAPDAPTSVEATGGDTQATVTFTAPASNGGATITGYTVTSSPGDISVNGLSSPISITGLTNGTAYTFNVTATNSAGLTSESGVSNEVTLAVPSVTSDTGRIWMDRNLGATRVAESKTDHLAYGDLYQWGRKADGHEKINWTNGFTGEPVNLTTTTKANVPADALFITSSSDWRVNQNINLWNGLNAVNNPCPAGFRVPTITEINAEVTAYDITNSAEAFSSPLKFTVQGFRNNGIGDLRFVGVIGFYWSSSVSGGSAAATLRRFNADGTAVLDVYRARGLAVRCIKEVTAPDAPTSVEATGGDTQATVTFTAPASNGGATITGYTVTSSFGEITVSGPSSPISITGLTNGTAYTFNVTATNSAGLVSESGVSNEVTPVAAPQVGDLRDGGVVFYIFQNGDPGYVAGETHGLVCAIQDQSTGIQWYNGSYTTTGATATGIGAGQTNTNLIISDQGSGTYAASVCDNHSVTIGATTYDDWFLPSHDELNLMYQNIGPGNALELGNIGGFASANYWSSTESTSSNAWRQDFLIGGQNDDDKLGPSRVRAVRAF